MEVFSLVAIPRLQRQPLGDALQKLKRKSTTILKMNSFRVFSRIFTVDTNHTAEEKAFCKTAISEEHLAVVASEVY